MRGNQAILVEKKGFSCGAVEPEKVTRVATVLDKSFRHLQERILFYTFVNTFFSFHKVLHNLSTDLNVRRHFDLGLIIFLFSLLSFIKVCS